MKLSKKLIAAIGMLTLSAVMLVTSSFAWFSMNDSVKATGMTVTAKGDQIYLQIASGDNVDWATVEGTKTTAAAGTASAELLPVAPRTGDAEYAGVGAPTWVTAIGTAVDNGNKAPSTDYDTAADTGYYLLNKFQIRLDPEAGRETAGNPLKVASIGLNAPNKAFSKCLAVVVVCEYDGVTKGEYWKNTDTYKDTSEDVEYNFNLAKSAGANLTDAAFGNKVATISVYVFFDGENTACTLKNLVDAPDAEFKVDVKFTVA